MLLFEWGSHFVAPEKKEFSMAFENVLRMLRQKEKRQSESLDETRKQIKELEDAAAKK